MSGEDTTANVHGKGVPFEFVFPALKGVQARREYFVSLCPLRMIPRLFLFNEEELVPELRAQRTLNKGRIPEIARYIVNNRDDYCFSALTASVDGEVRFDSLAEGPQGHLVGVLHIPMTATFVINDGQHRRAAIELAIRENPDLADESIAVVFFMDVGLERCQTMFADLNRHAIRPSRSLSVLYDHRDHWAHVARLVAMRSPVFRDLVEMERTTLAQRSRKLFTLSALHGATKSLLHGSDGELEEHARLASDFWGEVAQQFPEWSLVREHKMSSGEVRQGFIHSHGVVLHAVGRVGNVLLRDHRRSWKKRLVGLAGLDWRRSASASWEGRAMVGGTIQKGAKNVTLTTNLLKKRLKLPLNPEEQRAEDAFARGSHGRKKK